MFYDSKNNGYNLTSGGDGLIDPPEEIKKKISDNLKGEKMKCIIFIYVVN